MSDDWKKRDRPCEPCPCCGAELYEKFYGNGGWARTDKTTDRMHGTDECVKVLRQRMVTLEAVAEAAKDVCLYMDWDFDSPANPDKHPPIDKLVNAITGWQKTMLPVTPEKTK